MNTEHDAETCTNDECSECCEHDEYEDGYCINCGLECHEFLDADYFKDLD